MARERILIFTNHFYPENFKVNDVAFSLQQDDYDVTVITGIPNYPKGKIFKGYGIFRRSREKVNGVKIIRVPLIPRGNGKGIRLVINYFSYWFFLMIWSFFIALSKRYNKILVHHTSPIFIGIPAVLFKKMQRIPLYFWNLDLWPESIIAASSFRNKYVIRFLNNLVKWIYRNSDKILISSQGFKDSLISKEVQHIKIEYFPNWAEEIFTTNSTNSEISLGVQIPADTLKIMFAGNIGEAQDMESILNAILLSHQQQLKIFWIFLGDGRKRNWIESQLNQNNLDDCVIFLGRHDVETMPSFFNKADLMLVTLKDELIFSLTVPAKLQAYMASGKPILAMINGEGSKIIKEAKCGLVSPCGDYSGLIENAKRFVAMAENERTTLGTNGFNYYNLLFSFKSAMSKLKQIISSN
jgi:glycosyltransferase involved in cell wall biosynthesis